VVGALIVPSLLLVLGGYLMVTRRRFCDGR
jgi:hypothetical protein